MKFDAAVDSKSFKSISILHSMIIRKSPIAERRNAKGSLSPVGAFPIENIPMRLSIFSLIDKH